MTAENKKLMDEIRRLITIVDQLPKVDEVQAQWVKVSGMLTDYIETQMPLIEAQEELTKKWLIAGVALQSFLTELIKQTKGE